MDGHTNIDIPFRPSLNHPLLEDPADLIMGDIRIPSSSPMEISQDIIKDTTASEKTGKLHQTSEDKPTNLNMLQKSEEWERRNPKPLISIKRENTIEPNLMNTFHMLCQHHGTTPHFAFTEIEHSSFYGKLHLDRHVLETKGPLPNKKLAKHDLCKQAIPLFKSFDEEDSKKRKCQQGHEAREACADREVEAGEIYREGWVSMLHNYCSTARIATPLFEEYCTASVPFQYTTTCTLAIRPSEPFGSTSDLHPSKGDAKKAAAREAVIWLRDKGRLPPSTLAPIAPPSKRQKLNPVPDGYISPPKPVSITTPAAQQNTGTELPSYTPVSVCEQLRLLNLHLGFTSVRFESHASVSVNEIDDKNIETLQLIDMAAYFHATDVAKDARLAGPLGTVTKIYGRKKARELCSREVLKVLLEIQHERMKE